MKKIIACFLIIFVFLTTTSCNFIDYFDNQSDNVNTTKISTTKIELDQHVLTGHKRDVFFLEATLTPGNATDQTITWKSEDPSIATVSPYGIVKMENVGETVIEATASGGQKAYCYVRVERNLKTVTNYIADGELLYLDIQCYQDGNTIGMYVKKRYEDATYSNASVTFEVYVYYRLEGVYRTKEYTVTLRPGSLYAIPVHGSIIRWSFKTHVTGTITRVIEID